MIMPCKNCITLAMCKGYLRGYLIERKGILPWERESHNNMSLLRLLSKCSLLREYSKWDGRRINNREKSVILKFYKSSLIN